MEVKAEFGSLNHWESFDGAWQVALFRRAGFGDRFPSEPIGQGDWPLLRSGGSSGSRRSLRSLIGGTIMFRWLIASALLAGAASAADVADGRVTYNRDILPILEKN